MMVSSQEPEAGQAVFRAAGPMRPQVTSADLSHVPRRSGTPRRFGKDVRGRNAEAPRNGLSAYSRRRARRAALIVPSSRKSSSPPIGTPWARPVTATELPSSASAM